MFNFGFVSLQSRRKFLDYEKTYFNNGIGSRIAFFRQLCFKSK